MSPSPTEKLDWYQRHGGRPHDLDDCPACFWARGRLRGCRTS